MLKNKENKLKIVFIILLLILAVVFIQIGLLSCNFLPETEKTVVSIQKGIEVEVEIKEGSNLNQIAQLLEEKGIIDNALLFKLFVQQKGKEKNLLPGKFKLLTGSNYEDVLNIITAQPNIAVYKLVIPEGFTVAQIKERILMEIPFIEEFEINNALDVNKYINVYGFLNGVTVTLEGFLFPKTYEITVDYTAKNIIEMMLTQFQFETQTLDFNNLKINSLSIYDIVKIASLIEREAYIPQERELISAVIYNRLKIDMPLQIDATIRYALNKWDGIVTYDDLETDSPYNTYKYKGLPPTPICNPGIESIKAAINPADVDYLYYVVINENTHEHKFSTTLEEHEKAKKQ